MKPLEESTIDERIAEFTSVCPRRFVAPQRFEELLRWPEPPDIDPWWWLFPFRTEMSWWAETIRSQFPSRPPLVPFAKHGFTDDVFCFDGTDTTGNPRVYIVHTYASPGWEDRGYWDDFDVFMEAAEEEHAEWELEQREGKADDQ